MNCLRCGREIEEGASFCRECLKEVGKPLEESPYLSSRITLPPRNCHPQASAPVAPPKKSPKSERKKSRKGLIAAVSVLSVCCLLLTGFSLWLLREKLFGFDPAANQERVLEEENIHLSNELSKARTGLARESENADALRAENEELRGKVSSLEENLNGDRMEHSEMDFSIRELEDQNRKLEGQKKSLESQKKSLEGQNRTLKSEKQELEGQVEEFQTEVADLEELQKKTSERNTQLTKDLRELRSKNSSLAAAIRFVDRHIAFINKGSRYYHTLSCMDFDRSSGWFAYNIYAAEQKGYQPCPKCH